MSTVLRNRIYIIIPIIIIILAIYFISARHSKNDSPPTDPISVVVQNLSYTTIPQTVTSYAQIVSRTSTVLSAQANGVISSINFKAGQVVKKGETLFTLQSSDVANQVKSLEAQLMISQQRYNRNQRIEKLLAGSIAKIDLLQSKSDYEQSLAQYEAAKTIRNIIAPIDGIVSDTDVAVGDFVNSGQVLAHVVDQDDLQIKYQLPSQYAEDVRMGQEVTFYPSHIKKPYTATVSYISPLFDANNYSITLRADLKDLRLPLNAFGKVIQLLNPSYKTLVVPQTLVQTDTNGFYVYVLNNDKIEKQYFTAGEVTKSGAIEIKSGLQPGARIILTSPENLSAGQIAKVAAK